MNLFYLSAYTDMHIGYSELSCPGAKNNLLLLNSYLTQIPRLYNRVPGKAWNNSRPTIRQNPKRGWWNILKFLIIFIIIVLLFVLLFLVTILTE